MALKPSKMNMPPLAALVPEREAPVDEVLRRLGIAFFGKDWSDGYLQQFAEPTNSVFRERAMYTAGQLLLALQVGMAVAEFRLDIDLSLQTVDTMGTTGKKAPAVHDADACEEDKEDEGSEDDEDCYALDDDDWLDTMLCQRLSREDWKDVSPADERRRWLDLLDQDWLDQDWLGHDRLTSGDRSGPVWRRDGVEMVSCVVERAFWDTCGEATFARWALGECAVEPTKLFVPVVRSLGARGQREVAALNGQEYVPSLTKAMKFIYARRYLTKAHFAGNEGGAVQMCIKFPVQLMESVVHFWPPKALDDPKGTDYALKRGYEMLAVAWREIAIRASRQAALAEKIKNADVEEAVENYCAGAAKADRPSDEWTRRVVRNALGQVKRGDSRSSPFVPGR